MRDGGRWNLMRLRQQGRANWPGSHIEGKERMAGPFREWEERLYVGDHNPGKTSERLPSALGGGMEPLLYDSISCILAEAGKLFRMSL